MGRWEKYTFVELAQNARLNVKLAEEKGENEFYFCMSAILYAALTAEAYFNHIGQKEIDVWDVIERKLTPSEKLEVLQKHLHFETDFGREPFQSLSNALKIRNELAHGKTEALLWPGGEPKPETTWEKACTLSNAKHVVEQIHTMCRSIHKKAGRRDEPFIVAGSGATSGSPDA